MLYKKEPEAEAPAIEPLLLNSRQTATALGVSERQVFTMMKKGELPPKKIGNRVLFSVEMLKAFANGESLERWQMCETA